MTSRRRHELIFVHGMGGAIPDWDPVVRFLPGSPLEIDRHARTPEEAAERFARLALERSQGPLALCGYSMGGRIALLGAEKVRSARQEPLRLILLASGFGFAEPGEREARNRIDEGWAVLAERSPEAFWEKWYAQELFTGFQRLPAEQRTRWLAGRKNIDIGTLCHQLRAYGPGRHPCLRRELQRLGSMGIQTLYIAGELDKKYSDTANSLRGFPGVSVELIPGAGHILPLEAPAELAALIRRFLKR